MAALAFALDALSAWTQILAWMTIFFFASAGASSAYLTPSEISFGNSCAGSRYVLWCRHTTRRHHSASLFSFFIAKHSSWSLAVGYIVRQVDVDCGFYRGDFSCRLRRTGSETLHVHFRAKIGPLEVGMIRDGPRNGSEMELVRLIAAPIKSIVRFPLFQLAVVVGTVPFSPSGGGQLLFRKNLCRLG